MIQSEQINNQIEKSQFTNKQDNVLIINAVNTIKAMLSKRNIQNDLTPNSINTQSVQVVPLLSQNKNSEQASYILFIFESKVNIANIRKNNLPSQQIIMTVLAEQQSQQINDKLVIDFPNTKMQIFTINDLQRDILKHYLQPNYRILDKEESSSILQQYNSKLGQLPKISRQDPVAKYFNANLHDMFEIIRDSYNGKQKIYKVVV